jgi:acid phosphatase (class A)
VHEVRRLSIWPALFAGLLFFRDASVGALPAPEPYYLSNTNLALLLLPPPPEANSAEQHADLAEVVLAHKNMDSNRADFAASERRVSPFTFTPVIGGFFLTNRFPKTETFFRRVLRDTDMVVEAGKVYWERPRPYVADTNLFDGDVDRFSGSYPSGHSTLGTVFALLLSDIFPDQREAILAKGKEIGWHRVMLAKHYPTDIFAGRVLGQRIVQEMRKDRRFRRDLRAVRLELLSWRERFG